MENVIRIWKKEGETPLQVINRIRSEKPEYKDIKMTYAGRLDPLAQGEMIILSGEMVHRKNEFTILPKTYETDIVLGIGTDTFDPLGLVLNEANIKKDFEEKIEKFVQKNIGEIEQKYPLYSSKTVNGIQLHNHARENSDVILPSHKVTVYSAEILSIGEIDSSELEKEIYRKISTVSGDFRQKEILDRWKDFFGTTNFESFPIIKMRLNVGSGFYVRAYANDLGKSIGSEAFALNITRTKIG